MLVNRRRFLQLTAGGAAATVLAGPWAGRTLAAPGSVYGIDVSHWQGTINWPQVLSQGVGFAFIKATEGTSYVDPQFARNWQQSINNYILRGAYHFGRPGYNAVTQARHFVNTFTPAAWDLFGVLDFEVSDGQTPAQCWSWVQAFVAEYRRLVGSPPMIYCSPGLWSSLLGNPTNNLGCPLWVAHWGVSTPSLPRAWSRWAFWQWTSTGRVAGITGNVDYDYFNGSYWDLFNYMY
jgi:GH25 family lysozyme M1 (1,4-beta-N-acetylmuramidase)